MFLDCLFASACGTGNVTGRKKKINDTDEIKDSSLEQKREMFIPLAFSVDF